MAWWGVSLNTAQPVDDNFHHQAGSNGPIILSDRSKTAFSA